MKFLFAFALAAAAGVSAQDPNCLANYIVTRCLESETDKADACGTTDYDCLCAAYQAIATCYNNCPNDSRAPSALSQVTANCQNASMYGDKAKATQTAATGMTQTETQTAAQTTAIVIGPDTTLTAPTGLPSNTADFSAAMPQNTDTGAANGLTGNTGGLLLAVLGVAVAAL